MTEPPHRNEACAAISLSPTSSQASQARRCRPTPALVASYHTHGDAIALSRGLDRDRAVDETGNQIGVFGRRGARPLNREEMERILAVAPVTDPGR